MRKVAVVGIVGLLLAIGGAVSWHHYWNSNEQIAKRACSELVLRNIVAPATYKLFEWNRVREIEDTKHVRDKAEVFRKAESRVAELEVLVASIEEQSARLTKIHSEIKNPSLDQLQQMADSAKNRMTLIVDSGSELVKAKADLDLAQKELEHAKASGREEMVLIFDSQNRMGALVRSRAFCSFVVGEGDDINHESARLDGISEATD